MRVLVVDQDSASNLAITRSLRELYTVDCVTNKGDCLDLLRANTYEVIVATERLEDGSGLELLGQISKKWPSVLRIFAAERQRLQLLRGRLGPFELFQTLSYPIDPEKLLATLEMATAAQQGAGEEIELTGENPAVVPETADEPDDPLGVEQSDEFSEPRFARAGHAGPMQVASVGSARAPSGRNAPASRNTPAAPPSMERAPRPRRSAESQGASDFAAASAQPAPRARRNVEPNRANDLAAKFPGSGTFGPRRAAGARSTGGSQGSLGGSAGGSARTARPRSAANKAPPVRFPPLERTPPLERIPPLEPPTARNPGSEFSEAAAMARAARSNYEANTDEVDTKRLAIQIGGGIAVAAVVVFLAFKMFGSKSDAPKPVTAPPVAHAPEYPPEVTDLIAQIEAAFKADDFKTARADVDKLRQLSPSHPRLDFFDGLLLAKSGAAANGRAGGKKNGKSGGAADSAKGSASSVASAGASGSKSGGDAAGSAALSGTGSVLSGSASSASGAAASVGSPASGTVASAPASATVGSSDASPALAPETPVGITRTDSTPVASTHADVAAPSPAAAAATAAPPAPEPALAAAEPAHAPVQAAASRRGSGEPPPVVQEAKLVRRVAPDYPSAAKKDGISGFVDLEVTVSTQGVVENVSVLQSTPPDMFDKSAVAAIRKWKYEPRFVDGLPSQAKLKVHLEFGPNK